VGVAWLEERPADDTICEWYRDWTISCGRRFDLGDFTLPEFYTLPPGYNPDHIIDVAYVDDERLACAWYDDGKVSCGTMLDLDSRRDPYSYSLPNF